MKTLFVTIALAIASPALAWDDNDAIREQGFESPAAAAGHGQRQRRRNATAAAGAVGLGLAVRRPELSALLLRSADPVPYRPQASNLGVFVEGPEGIGS